MERRFIDTMYPKTVIPPNYSEQAGRTTEAGL